MEMIPIGKPMLDEKEINAVVEVLKSGQIAQGKVVETFEEDFAKYIGVKHAITVNSGTAALHLALLAAGLKPGDEVITTPYSFLATVNTIILCGAKPVFVDINPDDFCINASLIESQITEKTKIIMPVHLYGQTSDMKTINEIAKKHNLKVIEDACQAHGATFENIKAGALGDLGCFSFYPTKNMTTSEGGLITTNDDQMAETCRILRNHGQKTRYYSVAIGLNYRMTNISAAIGVEQLKKLDGFNQKRMDNAKYFDEKFAEVKGIIVPQRFADRNHVYHQYTLRVTPEYKLTRDELLTKLTESGISAGVYYPSTLSSLDPIKPFAKNLDNPVAEQIAKEVISIPVFPGLTQDNLEKISEAII